MKYEQSPLEKLWKLCLKLDLELELEFITIIGTPEVCLLLQKEIMKMLLCIYPQLS